MDAWPWFPDPTAAPTAQPQSRYHHRPDPAEALSRLRAGNGRFAGGGGRGGGNAGGRGGDGAGLAPYAVVVGCLDPRVPVEAVFGQGTGAICVVRSAGHVLDRAVLGSVEFAVTDLNAPLVVVLGHDDCRAVAAAVELARTGRRPAGARGYLADQIAPAVPRDPIGRYSLEQVTRNHVRHTVARLRHADHLRDAVTAGRLDIVGAVYRLDNGLVDLLSPQDAA
jgi:carbonic anhydrase